MEWSGGDGEMEWWGLLGWRIAGFFLRDSLDVPFTLILGGIPEEKGSGSHCSGLTTVGGLGLRDGDTGR
jgi:hypothetical protein